MEAKNLDYRTIKRGAMFAAKQEFWLTIRAISSQPLARPQYHGKGLSTAGQGIGNPLFDKRAHRLG